MVRLFTEEVKNRRELADALKRVNFVEEYSVAVEGLIFDRSCRWILIHRGGAARDEVGKLEGIGGRVESDGPFREELSREIEEEVGPEADIEILDFLEVKSDKVGKLDADGNERWKTWVIASFVCVHKGGRLTIQEPHKNEGFVYVDNLDVNPDCLSSSCKQSLVSLQANWSHIRNLLSAYLSASG